MASYFVKAVRLKGDIIASWLGLAKGLKLS